MSLRRTPSAVASSDTVGIPAALPPVLPPGAAVPPPGAAVPPEAAVVHSSVLQ